MVHEGRLARQLKPLGQDRADLLTSLVVGADELLSDNPVFKSLLTRHSFGVLAALYANACQLCIECVDDPEAPQEARDSAQVVLDFMAEVVALVSTPDPAPRAAVTSIKELLDMLGQGQTERTPETATASPESAL